MAVSPLLLQCTTELLGRYKTGINQYLTKSSFIFGEHCRYIKILKISMFLSISSFMRM